MKYAFSFSIWRAGLESDKPDVSFVPPLERRRLTGVERAALSVAWNVRADHEVPVVFASRWGEIGVTTKLMKQFHADGEMSPAGFSASVHNAMPGAFSLLTKNHAPYTAIAARDRSLESGLLEAFAMGTEVIFVYAEEATPDLYAGEFEDVQAGCAVAIRMMPCEEGKFRAAFNHTDGEPEQFAGLIEFLEGRTNEFTTSDFVLTRLPNTL